jgi:Fur family transcriptional regulator, ferric uptake regulator
METELSEDALLDAMERQGLRRTRPRQALVALVALVARWSRAGVDFTAESLWRAVRAEAPDVGRATVFRAIEALTGLGLLDRVSFADGAERYHAVAPSGRHHHHLTCDRCHRVVNIDICLPDTARRAVASREGFALSGHRVELFGRCAQCQRGGDAR